MHIRLFEVRLPESGDTSLGDSCFHSPRTTHACSVQDWHRGATGTNRALLELCPTLVSLCSSA